jgi:hypothetical protein
MLEGIIMAIIFVFTDREEERAKELGVNHVRLYDTSRESLNKILNDPFIKILMPFLSDEKERAELIANFENQIVMRKIWRGEDVILR